VNLLTETREQLDRTEHAPSDVAYIGSRDGHSCTWAEFEQLADVEYDDGYGGQEVASDLEIHFSDGGFLYRHEYDGSEGWSYVPPFVPPAETKPIVRLVGGGLWNTIGAMAEHVAEANQ
jgi:hypothetical protein